MDTTRLPDLVDALINDARTAHSGRAARTLHGSSARHLRQTVIALTDGTSLSEHDSPPEATLQVLRGHVTITAGSDTWEGVAGDLVTIPDARHGLTALSDSAVLLTVLAH
ncbi:cupin domain-containing protein [Gordonia sp. ABSL1-1]|uniref:cupin domain-containing protein n=1 Tax=Gordonia sp. ABSL1-1 TaxID=3053923 RepID=UPI0025727054|nr:cupin domain-containing protein [Gordonia sp. ABSL1-1]MDL9936679.1 cupin domain-containing protein [Gordonia sp. ABSL1-1]